MKKVKEKTPSLFQLLKLYLRSCKISWMLDKRFMIMQVLNSVSDSFRPYFNSIMAALIIDGIAVGKPAKTLIIYALIVVSLDLVMNVIVQYTAARRYIRKSMWSKRLTRFFNGYSEKMDYWRFEDITTREKWERIKGQLQARNQYFCGIGSAPYILHGATHAILGTCMSVVLLSRMLLAKAPDSSQGAIVTICNSSFLWIAFVTMLVVYSFLSNRNQMGWTKCNKIWNDFWGTTGKRNQKMTEFTVNNKQAMDMKIYNFRPIAERELDYLGEENIKTAKNASKYTFRVEMVTAILTAVLTAFSYCFVGIKALAGAFGIGSVVLYVTTMLNFNREVSYFGSFVSQLRGNFEAYEDQFSYIDTKREMYGGTLSVANHLIDDYEVEFRNVSFRYPGCEVYALRNINIKFSAGEKLAVVGMNGSGKTTFIKLLCRLYDPTDGEILLDGINIKNYKYDEYMAVFSVVFQDFKLFDFPLSQNVSTSGIYDGERVMDCLTQVGMDKRIGAMPHGVDTCLFRNFDPEGIEISGGESQKIALARALYKNAPFIILDEPTAALDPLAEAEVYENFNSIVGGKTAVYISHRLSSCRFCDTIAVFDGGKLVQHGSHDTLVAEDNGKYAELWSAQVKYYS